MRAPLSDLATYLSDHHAGSVGARELLAAVMNHHEPDRAFFIALDREIEEDQEVLEGLIQRIGSNESAPKKLGAWFAEKLSRLKLGGSDTPLRHLELMEALLLGVRGKLALWEALATLPADSPGRDTLDLPRLIDRAHDQLARIEARRIAAFAHMLGENDD